MTDPATKEIRSTAFKPALLTVIAIAGLIVVCLIFLVDTRSGGRYRSQCKLNLKQIAIALHNYHETHGSFPPAVTYDANGRPAHSWRVLILPFLENADLYKQYRFDEPWYFGVNHHMALALMFRQGDEPRLTQSPSGGGRGNPAWDFQYFVPDYKEGRRYQMIMRAQYLPYESNEQIEQATSDNRRALNQK